MTLGLLPKDIPRHCAQIIALSKSSQPLSTRRDPIANADDEARNIAQGLLTHARHAALAVIDPETDSPGISRIAFACDNVGCPITLISSLAAHYTALLARPDAALMVGEPGPKGDPLTHPRLMIRVTAQFINHADPAYAKLRAIYLSRQPKAKLYIDFADFSLVRLFPTSAILNGGFGRAWRLDPSDLIPS
jgi:heme iron utilization protein